MLIALVRIIFVLLAMFVGATSGEYFYAKFADEMPPWSGLVLGFGIAITIIAAEQAFRRHFNRSLVVFLVGLTSGLLLSYLLLTVLRLAIQDTDLRHSLDVPIALITTYLVILTAMRNADRFRLVIPFVEFRREHLVEGSFIVDAAALADGRFLSLAEAGLADGSFIVHRSVLASCEEQARSAQVRERLRGSRALETLAELRASKPSRLRIDDTSLPQATGTSEQLIGLARLDGSRLLLGDPELAERARAEGLRVLDLNLLGARLAATVFPGEHLRVAIEKPGENKGQGVGYLDDGSMVVVHDAAEAIGSTIGVTVLRIHHTRGGRMIFAEPGGSGPAPAPLPAREYDADRQRF